MDIDHKRTKQHLEILTYFSKSIFRKNTVNDIFWDIITNCIEKLEFVDCSIFIIDKERQMLVEKAAYGDKNINFEDVLNPIEIPIGEGIVGDVAKTGKPELISDTRNDRRYIIQDENCLSKLTVPIVVQNEVIGVIDSAHPQAGFYEQYHLNVLQDIASISGFKISTTLSLAERDDLVSLLMENPSPVFRVSSNLKILLYSKSARTIVRRLSSMTEVECYDMLYHTVEKALLDNKAVKSILQLDGKVYSVVIFPFFEQNYANLYLEDVTAYYDAKEQAEMEKLRAQIEKRRAERAVIEKSTFLAAASHDLRQPVQAQALFYELLQEHIADKEGEEILGYLRKSSSALSGLFNGILDISKLDANTVDVNFNHISLKDLLSVIKIEYIAKAKESDLIFEINIEDIVCHTDPYLLQRIVGNLLSNAFKYTEMGSIKLNATQNVELNFAEVSISDTGIGIPMSELDGIFSEYYQLDNPARDRTKGLGLGLAIVKRLSDLLGIEIAVKSEINEGSVFTLHVPLGHHSQTVSVPSIINSNNTKFKGLNAFVVDDDKEILRAMKGILEKWGFISYGFNSYESIVAHTNQQINPPDIVISDYRLENEKTGIDLINDIRRIYENNIPAILITGDTASNKLKNMANSDIRVLHKPIIPSQMRVAISQEINNSR